METHPIVAAATTLANALKSLMCVKPVRAEYGPDYVDVFCRVRQKEMWSSVLPLIQRNSTGFRVMVTDVSMRDNNQEEFEAIRFRIVGDEIVKAAALAADLIVRVRVKAGQMGDVSPEARTLQSREAGLQHERPEQPRKHAPKGMSKLGRKLSKDSSGHVIEEVEVLVPWGSDPTKRTKNGRGAVPFVG